METHERIMLNVGGVGTAAFKPILERINIAGDGKVRRHPQPCNMIDPLWLPGERVEGEP